MNMNKTLRQATKAVLCEIKLEKGCRLFRLCVCVTGSRQYYFVGQAPPWRRRERHKERAREAAMGSRLFL